MLLAQRERADSRVRRDGVPRASPRESAACDPPPRFSWCAEKRYRALTPRYRARNRGGVVGVVYTYIAAAEFEARSPYWYCRTISKIVIRQMCGLSARAVGVALACAEALWRESSRLVV